MEGDMKRGGKHDGVGGDLKSVVGVDKWLKDGGVAGEKRVYIIGTVHVSRGSAEKVAETIGRIRPDIVCVELDMQRFRSMQESGQGGHFRYSPTPGELLNLRGLLAWLQQRIGKEFGIMPGAEMMAASRAAGENKINLALIDQRADATIARLWGALPLGERIKLISYVLVAVGLFALKPVLGRRTYSIMGMFGENKTFDMKGLEKGKGVDELMDVLKDKFPTIYRVLVEERNIYMSRAVSNILRKGADTAIVVVGAGHVSGMTKILRGMGIPVSVV